MIVEIKRYLWKVLMILGCCMMLGGCHLENKTEMGVGEREDLVQEIKKDDLIKQEEKVLHQVKGVVSDATMNTLSVLEESGNVYTFSKQTENVETGELGIVIGNPVMVSYYGELDNQVSMQDVEVVRIRVSDPTEKTAFYKAKANQILETMSLEEKVGQMFIARCPEQGAEESVVRYGLGGYILFGRDFKDHTRGEVVQNIEGYQESAKIKLLIGVDEEGGTVNRVSSYAAFREEPFRSPQQLYEKGGWDLIISDTREKAALLKSLGINVNLAPVCDIATKPEDYMYKRSFGKDALLTAEYVEKVVGIMNEENLGSVLKHFPGYGNNIDTHTGIAYDERPKEAFIKEDFKPFESGIQAGAGAVLVSHNIIKSIDEEYPASLSKPVHDILREEMNFEGVIMTDDLEMSAIRQYTGEEEAAVLAVQGGNDLLCCTNFEVQIPAVIEAVKLGKILESRIDESVMRILCWKLELGIIE